MLRRYRHRRRSYAVAASTERTGLVRKIVWYAIFLVILYWIGSTVVGWFGGGAVQSRSLTLTVEEGSRVNASFDGGLLQPAETGVKLHPGDRVVTAAGTAMLDLFDGSRLRLDDQSDLTIRASEEGEEDSAYDLQLAAGALWIRTPSLAAFSGSVARTVATSAFTVTLPTDAETVVEQDGIIVFSADGAGVSVSLGGRGDPIIIGEGQQIRFPDPSALSGDPLRFRSAINPLAVQRAFVEDSRRLAATAPAPPAAGDDATTDLLTIRSPADGATVTGRTVLIEGSVDPRVDRVRVNGYLASINRESATFRQELALREGQTETSIRIEALDARGLTLAESTRTVRAGTEPPPAADAPDPARPQITAPAATGQTYRTQAAELVIRGTAPAGTQQIIVNDYQLQLFQPGNPTWSYLATTALGNLAPGRNVYNVYAVDANGTRSTAATLTILHEAGTTGVVEGGGSTGTPAQPPAAVTEDQLPANAPLAPGTLAVRSPGPGTSFTASGTGFLLEGTTSNQTASVWVNGYRLQLYTPGATFWNYIASVDLGTLKTGTNAYRIVARNAQGQILDTLTYTVELEE